MVVPTASVGPVVRGWDAQDRFRRHGRPAVVPLRVREVHHQPAVGGNSTRRGPQSTPLQHRCPVASLSPVNQVVGESGRGAGEQHGHAQQHDHVAARRHGRDGRRDRARRCPGYVACTKRRGHPGRVLLEPGDRRRAVDPQVKVGQDGSSLDPFSSRSRAWCGSSPSPSSPGRVARASGYTRARPAPPRQQDDAVRVSAPASPGVVSISTVIASSAVWHSRVDYRSFPPSTCPRSWSDRCPSGVSPSTGRLPVLDRGGPRRAGRQVRRRFAPPFALGHTPGLTADRRGRKTFVNGRARQGGGRRTAAVMDQGVEGPAGRPAADARSLPPGAG